jgi:hypothetical protein
VKKLEDMLLGNNVLLYKHEDKEKEHKRPRQSNTTRHDFEKIQAIVEKDSLWVQKHLISEGLSWAFPEDDTDGVVLPLLKKDEEDAIKKSTGMWNTALYGLKNPETVKKYINSYQVVEGRVSFVTEKQSYAYLNFEEDWKTDFTILVDKQLRDDFAEKGQLFDFKKAFEGKILRVRGWVESKNGPAIKITSVGQLDIIPEPAENTPKKDKQ